MVRSLRLADLLYTLFIGLTLYHLSSILKSILQLLLSVAIFSLSLRNIYTKVTPTSNGLNKDRQRQQNQPKSPPRGTLNKKIMDDSAKAVVPTVRVSEPESIGPTDGCSRHEHEHYTRCFTPISLCAFN